MNNQEEMLSVAEKALRDLSIAGGAAQTSMSAEYVKNTALTALNRIAVLKQKVK